VRCVLPHTKRPGNAPSAQIRRARPPQNDIRRIRRVQREPSSVRLLFLQDYRYEIHRRRFFEPDAKPQSCSPDPDGLAACERTAGHRRRPRRLGPGPRASGRLFPDHHLAKGPVDVDADHALQARSRQNANAASVAHFVHILPSAPAGRSGFRTSGSPFCAHRPALAIERA
jgi:hypothetical protein